MGNSKSGKLLFAILFLIMLLPLLQHKLGVITSGKLYGFSHDSSDANLNLADWWDGSYQRRKAAYLTDSFGFRSDFVRLSNQLDYSLYKKVNVHDVVAGTDGVLYEKGYIDEYCGTNFKGDSIAQHKLFKLKAIQDTLARLGKTLLMVYAPSKAYFFPDNFPRDLKCTGTTANYYHSFRRIADSFGINQIDCNGWFVKMKGKTEGILMSKQGVHWTYYGALTAADSIVRYLERVRHIDMPRFRWDHVQTGAAKEQELDIANAANLIFPIAHEQYSYPELLPENDTAKTKPGIVFLGDSFLWTFAYNDVMPHTSNDWDFWYYFNEIWNPDVNSGKLVAPHISDYDWFGSMMRKDCVVMVFTETNLAPLGYGFIEQAYDRFYPSGKARQ